jgi:hypothetical protein
MQRQDLLQASLVRVYVIYKMRRLAYASCREGLDRPPVSKKRPLKTGLSASKSSTSLIKKTDVYHIQSEDTRSEQMRGTMRPSGRPDNRLQELETLHSNTMLQTHLQGGRIKVSDYVSNGGPDRGRRLPPDFNISFASIAPSARSLPIPAKPDSDGEDLPDVHSLLQTMQKYSPSHHLLAEHPSSTQYSDSDIDSLIRDMPQDSVSLDLRARKDSPPITPISSQSRKRVNAEDISTRTKRPKTTRQIGTGDVRIVRVPAQIMLFPSLIVSRFFICFFEQPDVLQQSPLFLPSPSEVVVSDSERVIYDIDDFPSPSTFQDNSTPTFLPLTSVAGKDGFLDEGITNHYVTAPSKSPVLSTAIEGLDPHAIDSTSDSPSSPHDVQVKESTDADYLAEFEEWLLGGGVKIVD